MRVPPVGKANGRYLCAQNNISRPNHRVTVGLFVGAGLGAFSHLSRLAHAHSPLYRITAGLCFNLQVKELADQLTNNEFTN